MDKMDIVWYILIFITIGGAMAEEATEKPALMQRLVQTLPQIPNVIKGQMEGKPDELK